MKADIVIKNGLVCTPERILRGSIAAKNGIIVAIGADEAMPESDSVYDAKGLLVMPGVVEPHCHLGIDRFRDGTPQPLARFYEDFKTESMAAAVGGITTINTTIEINGHKDRDGNDVKGLLNRVKNASPAISNAYCDFRFYTGAADDEELKEFNELRRQRKVSCAKFYLGYKGKEAATFGHPVQGYTNDYLYRAFRALAEQPGPVRALIHCEDPYIIDMFIPQYKNDKPVGENSIAVFERTRPAFCEAMDLCKTAYIAHETHCPLYIVHISAKESVDQLEYFQSKGFDIIGETCLHYLLFSSDDEVAYRDHDWNNIAKVNPPIHDRTHREALWEGIRKGVITCIGTDTCNYSSWVYRIGPDRGSFWDALPGIGDGMSFLMSAMYSEGVNKHRMDIMDLCKLLSENPARAHGMYPQKGVLQPGSDFDVVVFDPNKKWVAEAKNTYSANYGSLYEGMEFTGKPVATFVRGVHVAQDGKIIADKPLGRMVPVSETHI